MSASAPTAYAPRSVRSCVDCAGRTGGCARNARFWQEPRLGSRGRPDREVYPLMSANQPRFRVTTMGRTLGVSPSGYYAWCRRAPAARAEADAVLLARVQAIHARSRGMYSAPRIRAELAAGGVAVGRKRVARVMRAAGLAGVSRRRGPRTTRRDSQARPAPDRVNRRLEAAAPNRLWLADITYVPTRVDFSYLAVVLDVFSRRVVGWAMAPHLRTALSVPFLRFCKQVAGPSRTSETGGMTCEPAARKYRWC